MPTNPTKPQRLGGNGYKAMAVVDDTLIRLRTINRLTFELDQANEAANYRLVTLLNARIRQEAATISNTVGNAALGKYGNV